MMARLGRRILHIGLPLMAAGLISAYVVLGHTGTGLHAGYLTPPLLCYGRRHGHDFSYRSSTSIMGASVTARSVGASML